MVQGTIFVGGFPSSGTDLLRNILNAHEQLSLGGEFPLLPSLASEYDSTVMPGDVVAAQSAIRKIDIYGNLKNASVTFSAREPIAFAALFARMLSNKSAPWVGSKTPQNTENIDRLLHLFPDARFIIVVRDVRDVAMSWQTKWGKSTYLCADKWQKRMSRGLDATRQLSTEQFLYIKFEDLLSQLESEASRICDYLKIPFDSKMLNFQEFVNEEVAGKINFGQAIVKNNSGKWVHGFKKRELQRLEQIAFPTMTAFGYDPDLATSHRAMTRTERVLGLTKDVAATIFVGNRSLNSSRLSHRFISLRVMTRKLIAQIRGGLN